MRTYSLTELFRLTRAELLALHSETMKALASLPADDASRLRSAHDTARNPARPSRHRT